MLLILSTLRLLLIILCVEKKVTSLTHVVFTYHRAHYPNHAELCEKNVCISLVKSDHSLIFNIVKLEIIKPYYYMHRQYY